MLKYGGEIVMRWVWIVCRLAWEGGSVSEDWKSVVIVPLYKGKG